MKKADSPVEGALGKIGVNCHVNAKTIQIPQDAEGQDEGKGPERFFDCIR